MTVLTMRRVRDHFVITGPDIEPMAFNTRAQARDWCREHLVAGHPTGRSSIQGGGTQGKGARALGNTNALRRWTLSPRGSIQRNSGGRVLPGGGRRPSAGRTPKESPGLRRRHGQQWGPDF